MAAVDSNLIKHLQSLSPEYHARLLELRKAVAEWLAYIPATFPHYTQHGVQHGDEIVVQLSLLLFPAPGEPTAEFSAVELYALAAAAYLHDSGMVASDAQKVEILESDEWTAWAEGTPSVAERLQQIDDLRSAEGPPGDEIANFLADAQLRYLLADFVRQRHHLESAQFVTAMQPELARFGFDDPLLTGTIAALCEGHGLDRQDLEDSARFPQRRSIRGEEVNVRFLALLLRLGDLLDISVDRACPLLQVAACPLPAGSLAHWSQYQRITHRLTAPDKLELRAECESEEEHRYLVDWCEWLAEEAKNADTIMTRSERHREWSAPWVGLSGADPTIEIVPSKSAQYIPSTWTLELDQDFVFQRLIHDAYSTDLAFVRELIQNAADASRCRALAQARQPKVDSPTKLSAELRAEFPIHVGVRVENVYNQVVEQDEERSILYVEDFGTGMDEATIERYFLQVGRSFYGSKQFRERYAFAPSSRFGLGFLSVFAVSDHVVVETKHHVKGEGLRLTLTGPKSYLLTERGTREKPGTRIEVRLRKGIDADSVRGAVEKWCKRLEFPIHFEAGGETQVIEAESAEDLVAEVPDLSTEGARLVIRAFPINRDGIEGELYVLARVFADGSESWTERTWAKYQYPQEHPNATTPDMPKDLICIAGIALSDPTGGLNMEGAVRADFRRPVKELSLSREPSIAMVRKLREDEAIRSRWIELIEAHLAESSLAEGAEAWKYKQRLMAQFWFVPFWTSIPASVPVERDDEEKLMSLAEIEEEDAIATVMHRSESRYGTIGYGFDDNAPIELPADLDAACISVNTRKHLSNLANNVIHENRSVAAVRDIGDDHLLVLWRYGGESFDLRRAESARGRREVDLISVGDDSKIGFPLHYAEDRGQRRCVLNAEHPFVQWVTRIGDAIDAGDGAVPQHAYAGLLKLLEGSLTFNDSRPTQLAKFVGAWDELGDLPDELRLPAGMEIKDEAFYPI